MYVLTAMIVLAILLACVVKLDRVVTSTYGIVMTSQGTIYVSPLNPSIVREVKVKVGQTVKKGQTIATLDPTFTQADLLQMQEHMASDQATVNREEAEVATRPYVFSATDRYQSIQGGIWLKRQAQYHSDLANFDGQIRSAEAQMAQALSDAEKYKKRLKLRAELENVYEPLLEKGYVSKLQVMPATDQTHGDEPPAGGRAERDRSVSRDGGVAQGATRILHPEMVFGHRLAAGTDRNDLDLTRRQLGQGSEARGPDSLDAPADAIVLKIGKMSPGSVAPGQGTGAITPGTDPLFTLVPLDAPVEAEIDVVDHGRRLHHGRRPRAAEARCLSVHASRHGQRRGQEHQRRLLLGRPQQHAGGPLFQGSGEGQRSSCSMTCRRISDWFLA